MRTHLAFVLAFGVSLVACTAGTANTGSNKGGDDDDDGTSNNDDQNGDIDTSNLCEDLVAGKRPAGYPKCPNDNELAGSSSASDLAECKRCERQTGALLNCAKKNSKCGSDGKLELTRGKCTSELSALQRCASTTLESPSASDSSESSE